MIGARWSPSTQDDIKIREGLKAPPISQIGGYTDMKKLFRVKYIDRDSYMNETMLESEDIMQIIEHMILIKRIRLDDIYSIEYVDSDELFEIREKEKRFKKFRRIIEDYIYNEIDLEEFDYSDYLKFLEKFYESYHGEESYLFEEFRDYIDSLNHEFYKILDL